MVPFETKVLDGVPVLWSPMSYSCLIPTIRSQVQKLHEGYECLKTISTIHRLHKIKQEQVASIVKFLALIL